ncbi:MAG TPA: hypothetical protein PLY87_21985 [Planctomycetaceae bacterium]|nr:hypothetical protein [Planctomycetaceae bacterium]HQZ67783.1 hypothetical protein [Planctomycetaceae bacterium]HRA88141.1 hypothetical protein [Planctomycetaceae bacterium]
MSKRFCRLTLCGLVSLTTSASSTALGDDGQMTPTSIVAAPVDDGSVVPPVFQHPHLDEGDFNFGETEHHDAAGSVMNRELSITPPGTLGETYTRVSHPVPIDKHPRSGMLAVKEDGTIPYLTVATMGGLKMKNGIWLFESARPLDPGACQIVRVEARETPQDIEPYATRFVRLIPGRIVFLNF